MHMQSLHLFAPINKEKQSLSSLISLCNTSKSAEHGACLYDFTDYYV